MATTTRTFAKAIYDKLTDVETAGTVSALTGGRMYNTRAKSDTSWPYIVFFQVSGNPDRYFNLTASKQRWQFSVFSKEKQDMQEATDIKDALQTLFDAATFAMAGAGLTTYTLISCKVIDHGGPRPDGDRTMATVDIEIQAQE